MPANPPSRRKQIGSVLGIFFVGQFAVQLINAITGITLVRWLPKQEYAFLTIANTMTATFSVLFDPVIGVGLQSLAAPVRQEKEKLSGVIFGALQWRWSWLTLVAAVAIPFSAFLLWKTGASWQQIAFLLSATLMGVPALTSALIYGTVPKLSANIRSLQAADVGAAIVRLITSVSLLLVTRLSVLAALAATVSQWVQSKMLQRSAMPSLIAGRTLSEDAGPALSAQMRRILPHSLFLCVQGHIGIWLLGYFGTVESLADLGALSRLGILLASVGVFAQQVLIPALSRPHSPSRLSYLAASSLAAGVAGTIFLVVIGWYWPQPFLWVLGPQYAHLKLELAFAMGFFSLSSLSTIIWWFNAARGWVTWAVWVPPFSLAAYVCASWYLRPSTTLAALVVLLVGQLASLVLGFLQSWRGIQQTTTAAA